MLGAYAMPKRRNPFGEITPLQRKTHVGFEQTATEEERQAVFGESRLRVGMATVASPAEKTKCLLFRGANCLPNGAAALPEPSPIREHYNRDHHSLATGSSESQLPSNGVSSEMVPAEARARSGLLNYFTSSRGAAGHGGKPGSWGGWGGGEGVGSECVGCRGQRWGVWSCDHCEVGVCGECGRQCHSCQATFCSSCSVLK